MLEIAHNWGSTAQERSRAYPCDPYLSNAEDMYFRAVDVAASPAVLFRWLCQMRVAPYSYDLIDNFGRRSPRELTPGLDRLEVGQRVMTIFDLVEFEPDVQMTLRMRGSGRRLFGEVVVTYLIAPSGDGRSRLIAKLLVRHPQGSPRHWLSGALLPWGDLVMMRKQLLNLKGLAERETLG